MTEPTKNQTSPIEGEVVTSDGKEDFRQRAAKFQQEFEALCEKYHCQLVVAPQFVSTNHGSWEISLQQSIGELPRR